MWDERDRAGSWTSSALNGLYVYLGFAAVFIAPEVLALVLFIIPFVRNVIETSDWRIFQVVMWWFQVS
jgi:callose synthase